MISHEAGKDEQLSRKCLNTLPIAAGPWSFFSSEALYQAAKFGARPDVQKRVEAAPTGREAAALGRTPGLGIGPD